MNRERILKELDTVIAMFMIYLPCNPISNQGVIKLVIRGFDALAIYNMACDIYCENRNVECHYEKTLSL